MLPKSDLSQYAVVYPFLFAQYYIIYHFANLTYKTHPGSAYQIQKSPLFLLQQYILSTLLLFYFLIVFTGTGAWQESVGRLFLASTSVLSPLYVRRLSVSRGCLEAPQGSLFSCSLWQPTSRASKQPPLHKVSPLQCFVACKSASFVCKTPLFNTDIRNRWT